MPNNVSGFQPGRSSGVVDSTNPNANALAKIEAQLAILKTFSFSGPGGVLILKIGGEEKELAGGPKLTIPVTGVYLVRMGLRMYLSGAGGLCEALAGVSVNNGALNLHADAVMQNPFQLVMEETGQIYNLKVGDKLTAKGRIAQNVETNFDFARMSYQLIE